MAVGFHIILNPQPLFPGSTGLTGITFFADAFHFQG